LNHLPVCPFGFNPLNPGATVKWLDSPFTLHT
jgi:hypothetical protein